MKGTVLVGSGWLLLLLGLWGPLPAQEPDARLRISPASGEPGEEVAVEFRGDISHPLAAFIIIFDLPPEAAEFIRTEVSGTASSHARPQDVIYNPRFFQGGYLTGVRFNTGTG